MLHSAERRRVSKVALMVGVFGSVMALLGAAMTVAFGGVGVLSGAIGGGEVVGRGALAAGFAALGMVGAVLVPWRPRAGAILLTASAIGGMAAVLAFYVVGGVLLLAAAFMAVSSRAEAASE